MSKSAARLRVERHISSIQLVGSVLMKRFAESQERGDQLHDAFNGEPEYLYNKEENVAWSR